MKQLTAEQIAAFRLRRSHLAPGLEARSPLVAVGNVVAIQAQLYPAALHSLALRTRAASRLATHAAVSGRGTMVKIWSLRGTLHLHALRDLPMLAAVLAPVANHGMARWLQRHDVSRVQPEQLLETVLESLGDEALTRRELADRIVAALGRAARPLIEQSWGGIARHASMLGRLTFGPMKGRETTYAATHLADIDGTADGRARALAELARRYLRCYAPATPGDFAYWAGITVRDARAGFAAIAEQTLAVHTDLGPATILRADYSRAAAGPDTTQCVRLLPHFDTYLLAHRRKDHLFAPQHYKAVFRAAGWISPVILVDGRVVGTWEWAVPGRAILLRPFQPLPRALRAAAIAQAQSIGLFTETDITVTVA